MTDQPASAMSSVAGAPCAMCGNPRGSDSVLANGVPICGSCALRVRAELDQEETLGNVPLAMVLGAGGAVLGAGVWAAIVVATNFEVGYVAVLVGFLAGVGVKFGAGSGRGQALQMLAALLAVLGLLLAKYFIFAWFVSQAVAARGGAVAWYDPSLIPLFPRSLSSLLSPFDLLWLFIAISAAYRVPAPSKVTLS